MAQLLKRAMLVKKMLVLLLDPDYGVGVGVDIVGDNVKEVGWTR